MGPWSDHGSDLVSLRARGCERVLTLPPCFRDTSNPPANSTAYTGQVRLAKGGNQGYGMYDSESLFSLETASPNAVCIGLLASGFHLADGSVEVTVPSDLDAGSDYQIVREY